MCVSSLDSTLDSCHDSLAPSVTVTYFLVYLCVQIMCIVRIYSLTVSLACADTRALFPRGRAAQRWPGGAETLQRQSTFALTCTRLLHSECMSNCESSGCVFRCAMLVSELYIVGFFYIVFIISKCSREYYCFPGNRLYRLYLCAVRHYTI